MYSSMLGNDVVLDTDTELPILCLEGKTDHGVTGVISSNPNVGTVTSILSTQCQIHSQ